MELGQIHEKVDDKLVKLESEIERFKTNIQSCDDVEQREILEKDLGTLFVIRDKLLKAKELTQQVSDLRSNVENPPSSVSAKLQHLLAKLGLSPRHALTLGAVAAALLALLVWFA